MSRHDPYPARHGHVVARLRYRLRPAIDLLALSEGVEALFRARDVDILETDFQDNRSLVYSLPGIHVGIFLAKSSVNVRVVTDAHYGAEAAATADIVCRDLVRHISSVHRPDGVNWQSDKARAPRRMHAAPAASLPRLSPAAQSGGETRFHILPADAIELVSSSAQDEETEFTKRAETRDVTARLTVYALTAIVMLIAFPVGIAILIFNILGGENLRTTAHSLALSGMGSGLSMTELGAEILSKF